MDDKVEAKKLFDHLGELVDLNVWETRDAFDRWHRWADPTVAEPSTFLWPVEGKELFHLQAYTDGVTEMVFLNDPQTLVTSNSGAETRLKVWNFASKRVEYDFEHGEWSGKVRSLVTPANKELVVIAEYLTIAYQPPHYGQPRTIEVLVDGGKRIETSAGGVEADFRGIKYNVVADDYHSAARLTSKDVTIHNDVAKKRVTFEVPKLDVAALSPDGKYFLGINDKLHIWESLAKRELFTLDVLPKTWCFLPDSTAIAFATGDKLVVWEIAGNKERFSIPLSTTHTVEAVSCTPDGRFLITGEMRTADGKEENVIALWDMKQPTPTHKFDSHKTSAVRLAVSRDGSRLASSSSDGQVKVWDLAAAIAAPQP
jgi:WD40 repeat protein